MGLTEYIKAAVSPTSKLTEQLSFGQAMLEVSKGKKVHKLEWKDKEFYGVLKDDIVQLHKPDGLFFSWTIREGDIIGNDYIVI